MDLNDEQKQAVRGWISEGLGLAEVQKRLDEDFKISMTYMDVRFLVDDLDLDLQDEPEPEPEKPAEGEAPAAEAAGEVQDANAELAGGAVSVSVDAVMRPGALVSGSVTFSDGNTAEWQVDQMGRLAIIPKTEGYQPPAEDIEEFQKQLSTELQKKGF